MTINKLIQNNDEVAWNEDINDVQDLITRDINQFLEGSAFYNTLGTLGSAIPIPLCLIGGFDITFTLGGSLNCSISPGVALVDRQETDVWAPPSHLAGQYKHNNCQTAYNTANYPLTIVANSDPTNDRIDVIGVKFRKVSTNETRPVQISIDNRRVIQNISVPKHVEYVVDTFTIDSGTLAAPESARMNNLDSDPTWLPLFAIRVVANTTGFATVPQVIDLRLFYHPKSAAGTMSGLVQPAHITTFVASDGINLNEWIGVYKNGIYDNGFQFPVVGSSKYSYIENPISVFPISIKDPEYKYLLANGITRAIDTYYYLYSFRPSARTGYSSLLITTVSPNNGSGFATNKACNPSSTVIPPPPYPLVAIQSTVHYLSSFKLFDNTEDTPARSEFQVRPFKRCGSYVEISGARVIPTYVTKGPGTHDDNIIAQISSSISGNVWILVGALTNPSHNGTTQGTVEVVPPHAAGIRVELRAFYIDNPYSVNVCSDPGESAGGTGFVFKNGQYTITSTVPLNTNLDIPFYFKDAGEPRFWICFGAVAPTTLNVRIKVLGYYESF